MKRLMAKKISKMVVAALVAVVVLLPGRAFAFSVTDLLTAYDKSGKLCEAKGSDSDYCDWNQQYEIFISYYNQTSEPNKQRYLDGSAIPPDYKTTKYYTVVSEYNKAVANGTIDDQSSTGSAVDRNGDCPDNGSVEVSIAVKGDETCVGSDTVNPIYAYLRNIIIFLGGAIGLAVVITIIVAGIEYSSSNGNPQNIAKAKDRLVNAVIGLVLYLFLAAILRYLVPQIFA